MDNRETLSSEARQILQNIINHRPIALSPDYYTGDRRAAVLVGIFVNPHDEGQVHVLLTKRTSRLRSHAGEIACPGELSSLFMLISIWIMIMRGSDGRSIIPELRCDMSMMSRQREEAFQRANQPDMVESNYVRADSPLALSTATLES